MEPLEIKGDILSGEQMESIITDISNTTATEIMKSQQNLKNFIWQGMSLLATLEQATSDKDMELAIVQLFKTMVALRVYLTGEIYVLNIETRMHGTIEITLDDLFAKGLIVFNNSEIEYRLKDLEYEKLKINTYDKLYQNLVDRLFPDYVQLKTPTNFIYEREDEQKISGYFFHKYFAYYKASSTDSPTYFFIEEKAKIYNASNAKHYNRGHVYEWYIEDINNNRINGNQSTINAVAFMRAHNKDNIPFFAAGDITRKRERIEAVQVKRFNNKKLVTCTQIRTVLTRLAQLTGGSMTKEKIISVIKQAFLPGRSSWKKVQSDTKTYVETIVNEELLPKWKKT